MHWLRGLFLSHQTGLFRLITSLITIASPPASAPFPRTHISRATEAQRFDETSRRVLRQRLKTRLSSKERHLPRSNPTTLKKTQKPHARLIRPLHTPCGTIKSPKRKMQRRRAIQRSQLYHRKILTSKRLPRLSRPIRKLIRRLKRMMSPFLSLQNPNRISRTQSWPKMHSRTMLK